mmetsp:Transcript_10050/g.28160  ORF Transcript_10050/g.28160 Transcript_10050/m.28160 type:complete len:435 (-) Transcript_10050:625-1929(-)
MRCPPPSLAVVAALALLCTCTGIFGGYNNTCCLAFAFALSTPPPRHLPHAPCSSSRRSGGTCINRIAGRTTAPTRLLRPLCGVISNGSYLRPLCATNNNDNNNDSNDQPPPTAPTGALTRASQLITADPSKSLLFSATMTVCGAALGPFLDSYHSLFGVLSYEDPITARLWGSGSAATPDLPALVTAWWVPELFGLAGFIIGWLYVLLDEALQTPAVRKHPSWPLILVGISFFTLQYWLSGVLFANRVDRATILNVMSLLAAGGFAALDLTEAGWWTSLATAVGGPAIEIGLIIALVGFGGYHYNDLGETGYFPLWIVPVYFLGGPAVGNLARGVWQVLPGVAAVERRVDADDASSADAPNESEGPRCNVCNDSRAVGCPNCDAQGYYITYGRRVTCPACKGRGLVMCRDCFPLYGEDPADIEAIREKMKRMPD